MRGRDLADELRIFGVDPESFEIEIVCALRVALRERGIALRDEDVEA